MRSEAKTVEEYLDSLPEDRREQISTVRQTILNNLPKGIEETMNWGMIAYEVPLSFYPDTYNNQPLMFAALASQKNHMAVYLSGIYCDEDLQQQFEEDYKSSGKKLNMGKSCVRFTKIENLPLEVIGRAIGAVSMKAFVDFAEKNRRKK